MSISSVGANSASDLAALQQQLQADQKILATDGSKKGSAAELQAALKVQTDEEAIAQAGKTQGPSVKSGLTSPPTGSVTASGAPSTSSSVDLLA